MNGDGVVPISEHGVACRYKSSNAIEPTVPGRLNFPSKKI
jgi:hypothetical protein